MEQRFIVNPFKAIASALSCLGLLTIGASMAAIHRWGSTAVFFLIALVFFIIAVQSGAVVRITGSGVRKSILGVKTAELAWTDVAEVGVIGTKVFNQHHPERTGGLYIYLSKAAMTEEERFAMALRWPPADKIYLTYDAKRLNAITLLWDHKIQSYNTGNLML